MPGLSTWFTWLTATSLTVTLGSGVGINSLYFPTVPTPITLAVNGTSFYIVPSSSGQTVPMPSGATSVSLTASGGFTIYVFATSQSFSPGA